MTERTDTLYVGTTVGNALLDCHCASDKVRLAFNRADD